MLGLLSINDLYHINVELLNIMHLWKEFGLALGFKPVSLEIIRRNNLSSSIQSCFTEMLAAWLKGEGTPLDAAGPSWAAVVTALQSSPVHWGEYASQIIQRLKGDRDTCIELLQVHGVSHRTQNFIQN